MRRVLAVTAIAFVVVALVLAVSCTKKEQPVKSGATAAPKPAAKKAEKPKAPEANTAVGAIPGAIPPMIGWAAARGNIGAGAWALFAIVFLWQLPHFFAIAWMYREDYSRAGFRMISSDDRTGERSASQSVFF